MDEQLGERAPAVPLFHVPCASKVAWVVCFALIGCGDAGDGGRNAVTLLSQMGEFSTWQKVGDVPLSFATYHPQGILKLDTTYYLSTVDRAGLQGYLIAFSLSGPLATAVASENDRVQVTDGARYHPGGLDVDPLTGRIIVPVAEYRARSSAILLSVDPTDLSTQPLSYFEDHLSNVIVDRPAGRIRMTDWDIGFYSIPIAPSGSLEPGVWRPFVHGIDAEYGAYEYQDCKHVSTGYALCSGVKDLDGVLDLLRFDDAQDATSSEVAYHVAHRVLAPQVSIDGDAGAGLPLTENPLTFEITSDDAGERVIRLYFVPYDGQLSHLLVYDVPT